MGDSLPPNPQYLTDTCNALGLLFLANDSIEFLVKTIVLTETGEARGGAYGTTTFLLV